MDSRALSQSELARRVGITQATIYKLLAGKTYGSTHIHKIARELQTTPAYLTGETDDPDADAPPPPELTQEERDLLECFRVLTPADRGALLHIARAMAGRGAGEPKGYSSTVHARQQDYHGPPRQLAAA